MDQLLSSFLLLKLSEAPRSSSDSSIPPQASIQAAATPSAAASTQALTPDPSQAPTSDQSHAQDSARSPQGVAESHLDQEGGIPDSMLNTIRRQTETVADENPRANRSRPLPTPNGSPQMEKSQVSEPAPFPAFPEEDEEALPLPKRTGSRLYPCINCPCTCPVDVPITFKDRKSDGSPRMVEEGVNRVMQEDCCVPTVAEQHGGQTIDAKYENSTTAEQGDRTTTADHQDLEVSVVETAGK